MINDTYSLILENNPLLQNTKFPLFAEIKPEHVAPAIDYLLKQHAQCIKTILTNKTFTWENLFLPLDEVDNNFNNAWSIVSHISLVNNTKEWRDVHDKVLPKISKYFTQIGLNKKIYKAMLYIKQSPEFNNLNKTQQKIINDSLRDFHLYGVALPTQEKKIFAQIQLKQSKLTTKFANNVLDCTDKWRYLAKAKEVIGLPEYVLCKAKQMAKDQKKSGFLFSLDMPTFHAIMTFAKNRNLRQIFYTAYFTRASLHKGIHKNKCNNNRIMVEMINNRNAVAKLLDFSNYAELAISTKTAKTPQAVMEFLQNLTKLAQVKGKQELLELKEFSSKYIGIKNLQPYDIAYCSEELRQHKYNISEELIREYFPVEKVLSGMFAIVNKLFGLKVEKIKDFSSWHNTVELFAIYAEDKSLRGYFYTDLYAREHKRGGAWMDSCRVRYLNPQTNNLQIPIAYLNCNFSQPLENSPSLLNHSEVVTLFHEFGHCLQHLLTTIDLPQASTLNAIPLDAVEFVSQFMENWCWHKESLQLISAHYKTQETLPDDIIEKLCAIKTMQNCLQILRQVEFSTFDLQLHSQQPPKNYNQITQLLKNIRQNIRITPSIKADQFMPNSFEHIFDGGYGSGYYSYKWSEMMSDDAFSLFLQNGILDEATGRQYLHSILEVGASIDPIDAFINFRGHKPNVDAMLKNISKNIK